MAVTALKRKPEPEFKTYHATVLVTRAEEMARVTAACDHAAVLATFVREDCDVLRDKLQVAEAEVKRLTTIIRAVNAA